MHSPRHSILTGTETVPNNMTQRNFKADHSLAVQSNKQFLATTQSGWQNVKQSPQLADSRKTVEQ